jgi:hypothetical protein
VSFSKVLERVLLDCPEENVKQMIVPYRFGT